jgi:hypothetical protein
MANQRLKRMLSASQIDLDDALRQPLFKGALNLVHVDGFTLREAIPSHMNRQDFPDKTGLECFINHMHFPANTKQEMLEVFGSVSTVSSTLEREVTYKKFRIIAGFDGSEATVRFHTVRPNEEWIDYSNLESFQDEGILVITVGEGLAQQD